MKKLLCLSVVAMFSLHVMAQPKTPGKTQPKPAQPKPKPVLKTQLDSFSYAVGMSIALQYKEFGVVNLNSGACMTAVNDVIGDKDPVLTPDQANFVLNSYINKLMVEKAVANRKSGDSFLVINKNRNGVITLPSGMQYMVVREGNGPTPKGSDTVTVHYTGTLMDGYIFDSSVDRGEPAKFTVNGVIKGWTDALMMMKAGSRWKLFIPADLAYGNFSPPGSNIPPGSMLIFDLELISIGQ